MPEKLYEVLGVDEDASRSEIQEAYRQQVKESHPDLSDDPDADERFQLVMRAKDVLTDPDERELYDDLGHAMYMDMFGDDDGTAASSGDGQSEADGAASAATSSGAGSASGGASDSEPSDSAASTSGSAAGSGSSTSSTASASTASGTTGDRASTSPGSDASTGRGSDASTGSGTGASTASGTGASTASGGRGPTRGSSGGVSGATVAGEAERSRKEWQAAARRGETDTTSPWSTGNSQGDHLEAERVESGIATKIRSQDAAVTSIVMLVVYPVFLFATIWPTFPTEVNVFIGVVTLGLVVYTLTEPTISLVVFGTWSVLTPLLLAFIGVELVSLAGLLALTASWVPFLLSVLLTLAMPD